MFKKFREAFDHLTAGVKAVGDALHGFAQTVNEFHAAAAEVITLPVQQPKIEARNGRKSQEVS